MAEEFEGQDLSESVFWGVDLTKVTMRDVNLTGARLKNVWLSDVDIDGLIDGLVVNGVDVTAYVNERDPWYPLRGVLRPSDVAALRAALAALDDAWAVTINRARAFTEAQLHESISGEWSFVQTQQHLVFCLDKWFRAPLLGQATFHAIGLPNTGSRDFGWSGLDLDARPSLRGACRARRTGCAAKCLRRRGLGGRVRPGCRGPRERHRATDRVSAHCVRGVVRASPLRRARPRPVGDVAGESIVFSCAFCSVGAPGSCDHVVALTALTSRHRWLRTRRAVL